ncbi:MAG: pentapeptide repeat-containing protein [Crocosphaera sp.]|nr:pentapeptide repeat-containing protein [Crocosphaera sp.]
MSISSMVNHSLAQAIVTLLVGFGVILAINYQQGQISQKNRKQNLEISQANNEEELLQKYLDGIETLILDYRLNDDNVDNQARNVARFKTLTVLRRLTFKPERNKAVILQFLYDTKLIIIQNSHNKSSKLNLLSCDFQKANLIGINLSRANLSGADLSEADLRKANLIQAELSQANFSAANLNETSLVQADLCGANLRGANLGEADLYQASLTGAKLSTANLSQADLTQADLSQADLRGANLRGADLTQADLSQADLRGANLRGADLSEAKLRKADLSQADLRGVDLEDNDLFGVDISEADLRGVNLSGAKLRTNRKIKSAHNWEKAIYTEPEWDEKAFRWISTNKKSNEEIIKKIRNDEDWAGV